MGRRAENFAQGPTFHKFGPVSHRYTLLKVKKAFDDQRLLFYDALQDLDVNVSDYVLSGSAPPGKVVHIVTDDGATANVHLHHS